MPSVDGVVRVHAASTPKRKFRLVFALTTLLPWDAPARSMSGQHGHELGGPPSPVERTLKTESLIGPESLSKLKASKKQLREGRVKRPEPPP